jgi:hypothetical protein
MQRINKQDDPWKSGNPYEYFMGRWSGPVAHKFLEWLAVAEQQRWLDVGCGTGVLRLRETLPVDAVGAIALLACAWAIRGNR